MKIYTRKGDTGTTQLIGGTRVPKHHIRIEAYGTVDELNSCIGLIRDQPIGEVHKNSLLEIQDRLFTIGSILASDPEKSKMTLPPLLDEDILFLENEMDRMDALLPEMKSFVLPGGVTASSFCHLARSVCRRAERNVTHLSENAPVSPLVLQYLNRLSDYLFVLARMILVDAGVTETPWKPRHQR